MINNYLYAHTLYFVSCRTQRFMFIHILGRFQINRFDDNLNKSRLYKKRLKKKNNYLDKTQH